MKTSTLPPTAIKALRALAAGRGCRGTGGAALARRGLAIREVVPVLRDHRRRFEVRYSLTDAGHAAWAEAQEAERAAILAERAAQGEVVVPRWAVRHILRWHAPSPREGQTGEALAALETAAGELP